MNLESLLETKHSLGCQIWYHQRSGHSWPWWRRYNDPPVPPCSGTPSRKHMYYT